MPGEGVASEDFQFSGTEHLAQSSSAPHGLGPRTSISSQAQFPHHRTQLSMSVLVQPCLSFKCGEGQ